VHALHVPVKRVMYGDSRSLIPEGAEPCQWVVWRVLVGCWAC